MNFVKLDITNIKSGIIAHGVNCQGIMGGGVALSIRNKWPKVYSSYTKYCDLDHGPLSQAVQDRKELLGSTLTVMAEPGIYVSNIFSQFSLGTSKKQAHPDYILTGLNHVVKQHKELNLPIYSVKIGCLRGGLDWETEVKPVYELVEHQHPGVQFTICDL